MYWNCPGWGYSSIVNTADKNPCKRKTISVAGILTIRRFHFKNWIPDFSGKPADLWVAKLGSGWVVICLPLHASPWHCFPGPLWAGGFSVPAFSLCIWFSLWPVRRFTEYLVSTYTEDIVPGAVECKLWSHPSSTYKSKCKWTLFLSQVSMLWVCCFLHLSWYDAFVITISWSQH